MKNVMVDLETMATGYRAAIVSIGAVVFDVVDGSLGDRFYETINLSTCQSAGQSIDASTVLWWLVQDRGAQSELIHGKMGLEVALREFARWLPNKSCVWGNGSNFDNRILREAYELIGRTCPWHYRDDRDMRTLFAFAKTFGVKSEILFTGMKHNALDDAEHQAEIVCDIYQQLGGLILGGG